VAIPAPRALARLATTTALLAAWGCAADPAASPPTAPPPASQPAQSAWYTPPLTGTAWTTVRPADAGFDSTALASALDWAMTQNSDAVVVLWRGCLLAERYAPGITATTRGPVFSAGKTITGALVGQLAAEGRLHLDSSVTRYLGAGWSRMATPALERAVTVRHLLAMASGLDDSLRTVAPPGARFYYNNPAYYQLFGVLEAAAGQPLSQVATTRLFSRIGMPLALAYPSTDTGEPGFVYTMPAREFARFGLLVLRHGRWDTTPVLQDSAFLTRARQPSGTDNPAYGWLWWLNGSAAYRTPGPYILPTTAGPIFPAAPPDLVAALGKDDKKLYLVPSLDLVVVRLGDRAPISGGISQAAISTFDNALWTRLMAARR
ncbi:MAG: serine hydrolase, partial [Gemmatimonadetes bacterium]|nr:serine hydrolase [Gemmatimonadota bacterium]